jgi:cytidine deaminase
MLTDDELVLRAIDMQSRSYCPYSRFPVGAALQCADGTLFTGCNVENAAYGSSLCAERTALVKAVSEGAKRFTAIAVAGEAQPAWPCGICRQVLVEFSPDMKVLCGDRATGRFTATTLRDLLPHAFGPQDLK